MRPSSSPSAPGSETAYAGGGLLTPLFSDPEVDQAISDRSVVTAMLRFESELAAAQAGPGLVPAEAAAAIAAAASGLTIDPAELGRQAVGAGNPVNPLVRQLTEAVPESARAFVHLGATSQDVLDTGLMLIAKRAAGGFPGLVDAAGRRLVALMEEHGEPRRPARTRGQRPLRTPSGRAAGGGLPRPDAAPARLEAVSRRRL